MKLFSIGLPFGTAAMSSFPGYWILTCTVSGFFCSLAALLLKRSPEPENWNFVIQISFDHCTSDMLAVPFTVRLTN